MSLSLKGGLGATPKSPDRPRKVASEGVLGRLGMKNTEMETNSAFSKSFTKRLFLLHFWTGRFARACEMRLKGCKIGGRRIEVRH